MYTNLKLFGCSLVYKFYYASLQTAAILSHLERYSMLRSALLLQLLLPVFRSRLIFHIQKIITFIFVFTPFSACSFHAFDQNCWNMFNRILAFSEFQIDLVVFICDSFSFSRSNNFFFFLNFNFDFNLTNLSLSFSLN